MATAKKPTPPQGSQLTPWDPEFRRDPVERLKQLREACPVHRDPEFGTVILSGAEHVEKVVRHKDYWVDPSKSLPDDPVRRFLAEGEEQSMLFLDDPDHQRLRKLVSARFTPRRAEEWRPLVRQVAAGLLDEIDRAGAAEVDLIAALAAPLPATVIAEIMGVDVSMQEEFKEWSEASNVAFFNPMASEQELVDGLAGYENLRNYFQKEIAKRRENPTDDLVGTLVAAEEDGDRLSETEVVTMCNLLLVAGNVTTTDLIGNGTRQLIEHPDELARLRADPDLIRGAVEEMLRFDPPVTTTGRIAPEDVELGGVPVRARESITILLSAANRDPEINADPDRFDITRKEPQYYSFGGGAHLCLGAHLARIEAQEAIGALVARYPNLRSAGREEVWKSVPSFRGLAEYWIHTT